MDYNSNELLNQLKKESESKSELMGSSKLTDFYIDMITQVATTIADSFNNWKLTANINGVIVNGGSCAVGGPISNATGIAFIGSIIGRISGLDSSILGKFPDNQISEVKNAFKSYVKAIGISFQTVFNNFLDTAVISNIQVNGGTCTCSYSPGPTPGTLIQADGKLSILADNMIGVTVSKGLIAQFILDNCDSNVLAQGTPTNALYASIDAIATALSNYHEIWMNGTSIDSLIVNGGVTFPSSPVVGATGVGGRFN